MLYIFHYQTMKHFHAQLSIWLLWKRTPSLFTHRSHNEVVIIFLKLQNSKYVYATINSLVCRQNYYILII